MIRNIYAVHMMVIVKSRGRDRDLFDRLVSKELFDSRAETRCGDAARGALLVLRLLLRLSPAVAWSRFSRAGLLETAFDALFGSWLLSGLAFFRERARRALPSTVRKKQRGSASAIGCSRRPGSEAPGTS